MEFLGYFLLINPLCSTLVTQQKRLEDNNELQVNSKKEVIDDLSYENMLTDFESLLKNFRFEDRSIFSLANYLMAKNMNYNKLSHKFQVKYNKHGHYPAEFVVLHRSISDLCNHRALVGGAKNALICDEKNVHPLTNQIASVYAFLSSFTDLIYSLSVVQKHNHKLINEIRINIENYKNLQDKIYDQYQNLNQMANQSSKEQKKKQFSALSNALLNTISQIEHFYKSNWNTMVELHDMCEKIINSRCNSDISEDNVDFFTNSVEEKNTNSNNDQDKKQNMSSKLSDQTQCLSS